MCGQIEVVVSEATGTSRVAAPKAEVAPEATGGSDIMPASGPTTAFDVSEPPNISGLPNAEPSNASESSAASATSGLANPSGSSMV